MNLRYPDSWASGPKGRHHLAASESAASPRRVASSGQGLQYFNEIYVRRHRRWMVPYRKKHGLRALYHHIDKVRGKNGTTG